MGVVYKAEDTKLNRPVALKFLAPHLLRDEEARKRFRREAQAAAALDHPNICTVYEIDEADERTFIVMAFLEGRTLSKKITDGPLKLPEALSIAIQMAEGLEAAHEKGIVHRDIKPDNVMLTKGSRGLVKLMDFGLAQLAQSSKLTREGTTLGTPIYMSPEQALGELTDKRTDVWALGVVLYEMVAGRPPFRGERDQAVIYSIANEQHEPLTAVRTGVPKELERIVDKCLAKNADERYQHVTDLLVDLQTCRRSLETQTAGPAPLPSPKYRTPLLAGVVALVVACLGLAWWLTRSPQATSTIYELTQLTRDSGYTAEPAMSPDGRLVAFASNRGGRNNTDIWVQQIGAASPVALTKHEANDVAPSFSPDGTHIVFWSERNGGQICVVPSVSGAVRPLAENPRNFGEFARQPRFSPDGRHVSFVQGGAIGLVPASGGDTSFLETGFRYVTSPVWSPDSRYLIFGGADSGWNDDPEWYVISSEGGTPIPTGALKTFGTGGLRNGTPFFSYTPQLVPSAWLPNPDRIIFAGRSGDACNIYQVAITPDSWNIESPPQRLTQGPAEILPAVGTDGRIAYTSGEQNLDIWSVAIDSNGGKQIGEPEPVIQTAATEDYPSTSTDGKRLVWVSDSSGNFEVWKRDGSTEEVSPLTATPNAMEGRALISPDGADVAFVRERADGGRELRLMPFDGGVDRLLVDGIYGIISWSGNSERVVYYTNPIPADQLTLFTVDKASGAIRTLSENPIHGACLSPNDRWLAFTDPPNPGRGGAAPLYVSPVQDYVAAPRNEWIKVTKGEGGAYRPWWSPDGRLIYFFSFRHGFACVFAVRFDPSSAQPLGEEFPVVEIHEGTRKIWPQALGGASDRLFLSMREDRGNIWIAEPVED
ncbi:MAG TPA: protein kinase [Bryobacterales bacterium]|nr:protein kinase [Bryobacterales bacterium]